MLVSATLFVETKYSTIRNWYKNPQVSKSNQTGWGIKINGIYDQINLWPIETKLKPRGPGVLEKHPSKFGSDWLNGWRGRTCGHLERVMVGHEGS